MSGTLTVVGGGGADDAAKVTYRTNKLAKFTNCAPFMECITEINNTQAENAKDLDVILSVYNFIEYCDDYSKTSGSLYGFSEMSQIML